MLLKTLLLVTVAATVGPMNNEHQHQDVTGSPIQVSCEIGVNIDKMTYRISIRNEGKGVAAVENNFDIGHGLAAIQLVDKETGLVFANKSCPDGWFTFGGPRTGSRRDVDEAITNLDPGKGLDGTFHLRWAQSPLSLPLITSDDAFREWLGRFKLRLRVPVAVVTANQRVEFFYISPWVEVRN